MLRWLHHLLEPHCAECMLEREERHVCSSCETLRKQLELANYEKKLLLTQVLELAKPVETITTNPPPPAFDEIKPKVIPWHIRKQMLEAEDRIAAQIMTNANNTKSANDVKIQAGGVEANITQSIAELERELGLDREGA